MEEFTCSDCLHRCVCLLRRSTSLPDSELHYFCKYFYEDTLLRSRIFPIQG
jgi:hypothetical protein